MRKRGFVPVVMGLCAIGATAAWAAANYTLNINGSVVSTAARSINGQMYVPVKDVAKALNMKVSVSGNSIKLLPAGGTYQVANKLQGKLGEELFSGKYGFKVLSVDRTKSYNYRFVNSYQRDEKLEAEGKEELVIVNCRLKNGTSQKDEFAFSARDYGMNTSLTDLDAQSYQPTAYDVMADESAPLGKYALPGASINFSIIFRVPPDTKLKDLVFSTVRYAERGDKKSTDFRVALQ